MNGTLKKEGGIKATQQNVHQTTVMNTVGSRIISYIDMKRISEYELSRMTGISTSAINSWRNENKDPQTRTRRKVCRALKLPYSFFTDDELWLKANETGSDVPDDETFDDEDKKELHALHLLSDEVVKEKRGKYAIVLLEFLSKNDPLDSGVIKQLFFKKDSKPSRNTA